jgi:hypothetical protein
LARPHLHPFITGQEAGHSMATIHTLIPQRRYLLFSAVVLASALRSHAQSATDSDAHTLVLHVQSRLVVVDVAVEDANGNPKLTIR